MPLTCRSNNLPTAHSIRWPRVATAKAVIVLCSGLMLATLAAAEETIAPLHAQKPGSEQAQSLSFELQPGLLESNLQRLLTQHSDYQVMLWHVSKQYQVVAQARLSGRDVPHLIDQIIDAYRQPSQLKATFYRPNRVVRFHYATDL